MISCIEHKIMSAKQQFRYRFIIYIFYHVQQNMTIIIDNYNLISDLIRPSYLCENR